MAARIDLRRTTMTMTRRRRWCIGCSVLLLLSLLVALMTTTTTANDDSRYGSGDMIPEVEPDTKPDDVTCVIEADGTQVCTPNEPEDEEELYAPDEEEHYDDYEEDYVDDEELGAADSDAPLDFSVDELDLDDCTDQHEQCAYWSTIGECEANPSYMLTSCPHSCKSCTQSETSSIRDLTRQYGKRQNIPDDITMTKANEIHKYMTEQVFVNESYVKVRSECKNREKECTYWASVGECENNKAYMLTHCAPACFTCDKLDYEARCPFDRSAPKVLEKEGDLNRFFERFLEQTKKNPAYSPTIFSGPAAYTDREQRAANNITYGVVPNPIVDGPWLITLEEVFSEEECQHLIQLGYKGGYERSMDVGKKRFDGTFDSDVNPTRTSTNSWCSEECNDDPLVMQLAERIENLTGVPSNNSEYWQLLRYEETQQYNEHHDWIDYQLDRPEGVRIFTIFFYLNTVEAGGGTRFPALNITVQPIRGRVVIWPSTLNEDPDAQDIRTNHAALPVEKGIKYGANAWIHQRDYKTSHHSGCT